MTRNEKINEILVTLFKEHNIEDTPTNRIQVLTGIRNAWRELGLKGMSEEKMLDKTMYLLAITTEIALLQIRHGITTKV